MSFTCIELYITDDPDFGCTITFSDTKSEEYGDFNLTHEIFNPKEKYLTIQRTYPEARYENDYYHIETSETDTELGYLDKILVYKLQDTLKIQWCGDEVLIRLKLEATEVNQLTKIIKTRFKEIIILIEQ